MSAPALSTFANGVSEVSGDNLNTFGQTCDNVANLRGFVGVPGSQVYMRGYVTVNDGGQGQFYWNAAGTGPDDAGVTNIVPNGVTVGCWTRLNNITSTSSIGNNLVVSNISGGTAVPIGNTLSNIIDSTLGSTRGDILYRGAFGWAVLNAGAAGTVLTANGAGSDPSYQAVPGGAGAVILLSTQTISSPVATVDFTSGIDSTYKEYIFELINLIPATDGVTLRINISTDGGSSWKTGGSDYSYVTYGSDASTAGARGAGSTAAAFALISLSGISNASNGGYNGQINLDNPSNSSVKTQGRIWTSNPDTTGILYSGNGAFKYNTAGAINGIRFVTSSGNITSGIFKLFGVT